MTEHEHMDPERLAVLTRHAIEAAARGDGAEIIACTMPLWAEGGPLETLAFVTGCLRVYIGDLPPAARMHILNGRQLTVGLVDQSGRIVDQRPIDDIEIPRIDRCLAQLTVEVIKDDNAHAWEIWSDFLELADPDEVTDLVGLAVYTAGMKVRTRRARMS